MNINQTKGTPPAKAANRGNRTDNAKLDAAFKALDANQDGKLAEQELLAKGAAKFASRDANGDGKVTRREARLTFKDLDDDQDGSLAADESRKLARHDQNADGAVSREEFETGQRADRAEARRAIRDHAFDQADGDKDGMLSAEEAKRVKRYDADGDGAITRTEFRAGVGADWRAKVDQRIDRRFDRADKNGDGRLNASESSKYDRYDVNGDGRVSKLEFHSGQEADRKAEVTGSVMGETVKPDYLGEAVNATFERLDRDADGRLTGEEAKRVKAFDVDRDGAVSRDEYAAGMSKATAGADDEVNGATRFVLSSFNVLSTGAGKGKGYAPGPERMQDVARILKANDVSVVGLQEMAHDQLVAFKKNAGDEYGTFAGASGRPGYHDTTIAWRKDNWKLIQGDHLTVPSYGGMDSKVPYVLLRNKQTGQEAYFIDAHNPANTRRFHNQERFRDAAARQEAALAKKLLEKSGLPVFVMGDMNSVGEAQKIFTERAPLKAANPAGKRGIDWIFGSKDVKFSKFRREKGRIISKTTDHPVVFTNVKIDK